MKSVYELFSDSTVVAEVDAHPDDYLMHGNLHAYLGRYGIQRHNITLTLGEATTKNYRDAEGFDPCAGHRMAEGMEGAHRLGFATYEQLQGTDGRLYEDVQWLTAVVAGLLVASKVDVVVGPSQMGPEDSPDHTVAGEIALAAAKLAHDVTGRDVRVLTLQPDSSRTEWVAESSHEGALLAYHAAAANGSQFRIADTPKSGWLALAQDFHMHPRDFDELHQYPVGREAGYALVEYGKAPALPAGQEDAAAYAHAVHVAEYSS